MICSQENLDREIRRRSKPLPKGEFLRIIQRRLQENPGKEFHSLATLYANIAGYVKPKVKKEKEKKRSKALTDNDVILQLERESKR